MKVSWEHSVDPIGDGRREIEISVNRDEHRNIHGNDELTYLQLFLSLLEEAKIPKGKDV